MQSPTHYKDTKLMDLLIEKNVAFAEGNIMKYVYRWKEKDGIKDLYKARDYLNAIIAHEELANKTLTSAAYHSILSSMPNPAAGVCMPQCNSKVLPTTEGN